MNERLRVCLLHNQVAPYRLPVFAELDRHADVEVLFCRERGDGRRWDTTTDGYGFRHAVLRSRRLGPFVRNPGLLRRLLRERHDVYLVGDFPETMPATFTAVLVAKLRRRPVVLWSETLDNKANHYESMVVSRGVPARAARALLTAAVTAYRRVLLRQPVRFVALSEAARLFLVGEGVPAERIDTGIQVQPARLLAAPVTRKGDGPFAGCRMILSMCYLNPTKGVDALITAFRGLTDPDLRLVVAGSGPAEPGLRALAAGDHRISFPGHVSGVAHADLFAWADVFVLPTLVDCWGLVVNEALHHGVPVVTTTAAGARELVADGRAGLLVPPGDSDALRTALARLLADPAQRTRMAAAARGRSDVTDPAVGAAPLVAALRKVSELR
ncbi:glycosyltransferase family 4 protein [Krasilnikovia sp. MM14-A1259]|uniref:glycosyltransferase family 4 protein n=1 Tax=Krasilnikovia sp. MM14-A1259 TaxID=3373539 RepID=UPI0037FECA0E